MTGSLKPCRRRKSRSKMLSPIMSRWLFRRLCRWWLYRYGILTLEVLLLAALLFYAIHRL